MQWECLELYTEPGAEFKPFDTESLHGTPWTFTSAAEIVETADLF